MKSRIAIVQVALLIFSVIGCTHTQEASTSSEVDVVIKDSCCSLGSHFTDFELLSLSDSLPGLLKYPAKMCVSDSHIYVFDKGRNEICNFDKGGNYLGTIGKIGHAADEYVLMRNFSISSTGDTIAVVQARDVKYYTKENRFIGKYDFPEDVFWEDMAFWNDYLIVADFHRRNPNILTLMDKNSNILSNYYEDASDMLYFRPIVIDNIQQDKKYVCICDFASSSFIIFDKNTRSTERIFLKSNNMLKEDYLTDPDFADISSDHIRSFVYSNGKIYGNLYCATEDVGFFREYSFVLDVESKKLETYQYSDFSPKFLCASDDCFYMLLHPDLLIETFQKENPDYSCVRDLLQVAYADLGKQVSETDNYYMLKMRAKG